MSAGSGDVVAHGFADGGGDAGVFEHFLKCILAFEGALSEGVSRCLVVRDEIYLYGNAGTLGKVDEFFGVFFCFVHAFDEDIFEGDVISSRGIFGVGVAHPLGKAIKKTVGGGGDDFFAGNGVGAVKRYRDFDGRPLGIAQEFLHLREHADGRDGNARVSDIGIFQNAIERCFDVFVVGERFAHAHIDDIGDALGYIFLALQKNIPKTVLVDDFIRGEVACKPHFSGGAKGAIHRASHLARHANRPVPACISHQNGFDAFFVDGCKRSLEGVPAFAFENMFRFEGHPGNFFRESLAQIFRERGNVDPSGIFRIKKRRLDLLQTIRGKTL